MICSSTVRRVSVVLVVCALVPGVLPHAGWAAEPPAVLLTAQNPDPGTLPTLAVYAAKPWRDYPIELRVSATFPNIPDFTCDSWCYESAMDCIGILALDGGCLELRHRDRNTPQIVYVTTVTPRPGAVEFLVHARLASGETGPLPDKLQSPELCLQLKRAPNFASEPDPYPDFVKRCFIFTEKGRTFLDHTDRKLIPNRPATVKENNPPWVQIYTGNWQKVPETTPTSSAAYSPDQYVTTVIGAVSRDGKHLVALVNDSAPFMSQLWHDCMHDNARWQPADAPPEKRTWRVTVYAMQNDPAALMKRALEDYPKLHPALITADAPAK